MPHVYMWKEEKDFEVNVFCLLDCIFMFVIDFMLNFAQKNCLTFRGGEGGGLKLNVTMTLFFKK